MLPKQEILCYNNTDLICKNDGRTVIENGGRRYEAYQDTGYGKVTEHGKKRRLRRMPDILPVSMQDILHSRKSEL